MTHERQPVLPKAFVQAMEALLGKDELVCFLEALEREPPITLRVNPFKPTKISEGLNPVPWCGDACYLPQRPSFTLDPLFHAGAYYVQESSSTFIQHILESIFAPRKGCFLDLCAAPGGKSTLLSSYLGEEGLLVANEVIKNRAQVLRENVIKWGLGNVVVSQNDVSHFQELQGMFDVVLIDAPCSGEGMFRKDPAAISEWSPEHVNLCAARQKRILDQAGSLPKGGGYLIYATCTYNFSENEENIRFLAEEFAYEPVRIPITPSWGISESEINTDKSMFYGYRFYPHNVAGEGLFVSVLKRPESSPTLFPKKHKDFRHPHVKRIGERQVPVEIAKQLRHPGSDMVYGLGDSYFSFPRSFQAEFEALANSLNLRYFGVELGKTSKNQWLPSHEWALSTFPKEGVTCCDLDLNQALQFLRKENIAVEEAPVGWVLATYKNQPLGWFKNIGNRINNYYPKEWRIRMD